MPATVLQEKGAGSGSRRSLFRCRGSSGGEAGTELRVESIAGLRIIDAKHFTYDSYSAASGICFVTGITVYYSKRNSRPLCTLFPSELCSSVLVVDSCGLSSVSIVNS